MAKTGERAAAYRLVRRPSVVSAPLELDRDQRAVVDHRTGPLLVIGGPGTGKTTTLVEAVARRVAEGASPESLLVLTFGRRSAARLKDAIGARIGRTAGEPVVRTFHGYAFGVLRLAAAARGEPPPRLLTGPEQDLVIRELLAGALADGHGRWPAALRPALPTRGFAAELRDLLLRGAERGVPATQLAAWGKEYDRPDWVAAAAFLDEYVSVLALRDAAGAVGYDTAELIRAAVGELQADRQLLDAERRRLAYVYVDELHDTDPAQRDLLDLVAGGGGHLVGFGDPDSGTFGFRGTDPAGLAEFPERFRHADGAPARTVTLTTCWRTGGPLLEATRRIGRRLRGPARHRQLRAAGPAGAYEVAVLRSATEEAAYVAHRLREAHLRDGVPWSAMAVLVRSTAGTLGPLRRALSAAGVPVATAAEDLPLGGQPAVVPLLTLVGCAVEPARLDEDTAVALLHSPYGGADPLAERRLRQGLRELARAAGDQRPSGVLLVEALRSPVELAAVERRWAEPARRIAKLLAVAGEAAGRPGSTVEHVLWAVWQAAGLADRWERAALAGGHRGAAADRDLDAIVALFEAAARFVDRLPGARPEVFLDHVAGQQLPADTLAPTADRGDAVRVLTAHAAKGREWDVVAVSGVQEGTWPDLRLRGSLLGSEQLVDIAAGRVGAAGPLPPGVQLSGLLDEERRLFYVAATRARRRLLVTAAASEDAQPSRFLDELRVRSDRPEEVAVGYDALPRPLTLAGLVAELRGIAVDAAAELPRRGAAAEQLARLAAAGVRGADPDEWWGLRELSDDRPLALPGEVVTVSPSTVETVNQCGLRWLLARHGGDDPPAAGQTIGNLVHAAGMLATGADVDRDEILDYVAERFDRLDLGARWLAGRERRRVEDMIDRLLRWVAGNPRQLVAIEREFAVALGDDVELRGRVDRLERDERGRLVVVDLKTTKTVPAASRAADNPQLAAYQVAVAAGAFPEGDEPGGAALLQLSAKRDVEQPQPALADAEDPGWADRLVRNTARAMAAATFDAVRNDRCRSCPVRTACPLSDKGRQVSP